jgi:hypothetical protein
MVLECGMDLSGLGNGQLADSCDPLDPIKGSSYHHHLTASQVGL